MNAVGWHRAEVRAMGGSAVVGVHGEPALLDLGTTELARLEALWSRFVPGSDIDRINRAGGEPVRIAAETVELITAMCDAWRATRGAFDPALLVPLVRLGGGVAPGCATVGIGPAARFDADAVVLDARRRAVRLPAATLLDPGGIGKGLAADLVADLLLAAGAPGAMVDVGGDVRLRGAAPAADGWHLAVGSAGGERIRLTDGGVATSGTERRAWTGTDGHRLHHLLHPAFGTPVDSDIREVTVIAGTAAWAEAWTKAVIVHGPGDTFPSLDGLGLAARARLASGAIERTATWASYAVCTEACA